MYQKSTVLIISILYAFKSYECVRNCNTKCTVPIQLLENQEVRSQEPRAAFIILTLGS